MSDTPHKILGLYDVKGWAYERRLRALEKYAPADLTINVGSVRFKRDDPLEYDLIFVLCYGQCKRVREHLTRLGNPAILVAGYNCGWQYRGEYYHELQQHADFVVFNNYANWFRHGKPPHTACISNGVDRELFRVHTPLGKRTPRVLWTGSRYHVQHGDVKNYVSLLEPLAKRLKLADIESDYWLVNSHGKERRDAAGMVQWYNTGTVYVVASDSEGTPNPALEAASCGCVICSTRVGNMPELIEHGINGALVDRTLDALYDGVQLCIQRYPEMCRAMQERIDWWDWRFRAEQYYVLFRQLIEKGVANEWGRHP